MSESKPKIKPQYIEGSWVSGIVLDFHTVSSVPIVRMKERTFFHTERTEVGELLFSFKYRNDLNALKELLSICSEVFANQKVKFDVVVPIPPSNSSKLITKQIAKGLAKSLNTRFGDNAITKQKVTEQLKQVEDHEKRKELLQDAFIARPEFLSEKTILLVDDLYRSGATLEAATEVAYKKGGASAVYVFAVTRTRVRR